MVRWRAQYPSTALCPCLLPSCFLLTKLLHVGIQSQVRAKFLGRKIQPASPLTAYNINVPRSALAADPELEFLLGHSGGWFGPHRFIMAMDMPDYNDYSNFCFCSEKGNGKEGEWFIKGDIRSVRAQFSDFEPRIQKILALADPEACYLWSLSDIPTLETWRSKSGKAILIGDAAHAVLPYAGMVRYWPELDDNSSLTSKRELTSTTGSWISYRRCAVLSRVFGPG